ncbi:NmrA family NAD(P)-binding protein [Duganella sp. FT27W]|uniref:NmrA family NAD(P)-binding protein n=1 Tax=Duganella sp. FT27W TaxID=2654636 RepID=UPI00128D1C19|nr:NmrA family NAD(P)-binding protein [Duganella sp. FT27W]MPQ57081.1 NAD(P)H-binding protein [Duganella sp. FT27W]
MSSSPILVTGATGKTGRRVAAVLAQRGFPVRAVSRNSTIRLDWDDASTWPAALQGVRAVYIVHPGLGGDGAAAQVEQFVRAAAAAGVEKAVLASTPDDGSDFSRSMRAAESHIVAAGLQLTSLRLRWFFQNFSEDFLLQPVLSGELRLPAGDGKEAFVDADDIAEVAVAALTDARHNGRRYDLTGPRLLSFADVAREITDGAGHPLTYVPVDSDTYVAEQLAQQVPQEWARAFAALYQDIASGKLAQVSADVEAVLGKPARDFSGFVSNTARGGAWKQAV